MRLLLDEMLSPRIATELRLANFDVAAISESAATRAMSDSAVLELATAEGRVVVTANIGDFVHLSHEWAAQGRDHTGILLVTAKRFPQDRSRIGRVVQALLGRAAVENWPRHGQIDFL